ncbi:zf-HC2 domain-containing protein [Demequina sp. SYSU T00039]|uniref:Zf-HC2 domain-containing protein n=1 Tax=Demequina lignilytica TaxID=3051663 RepID=A0AAW7M6K3_9MICO|nr:MULTISPECIES: zf-HC2 domain-containing protein [unclassified Demequina]MDN4477683.1 zf-HC2 domain-containing protein [Demequina sp. SYSU T00039-1]MDN4487966.1 zf-HC2 domain-containing protein [Demequina sp. SYSU T00039]MDN4490406.1 zf-HC2 domain-containing protein [Demequina sp. SYSU T00068]
MTAKHLGERVHDLLDNRLPAAAAAEAMAHLSGCEECTTRWNELRTAREALNSSECGIDMAFARQLLDRERMQQMAQQEPAGAARAARGRDRRPVVLTMSLAMLLVAVLGAAYVAGAPQDVTTELSASSEDGSVSVTQVDRATMLSGDGVDGWLQPEWEDSGLVPVGGGEKVTESGITYFAAALLAGSTSVQVVEFAGRLNPASVVGAPVLELDGIDAYVIGSTPTRIVWQAGEHVVFLTCHCTEGTLQEVAIAFPQDGEPGAADQIMSGLGVFVDALTGK